MEINGLTGTGIYRASGGELGAYAKDRQNSSKQQPEAFENKRINRQIPGYDPTEKSVSRDGFRTSAARNNALNAGTGKVSKQIDSLKEKKQDLEQQIIAAGSGRERTALEKQLKKLSRVLDRKNSESEKLRKEQISRNTLNSADGRTVLI